jgi:uncharacterized membrane protein
MMEPGQEEINDAEWNNPDNWAGDTWFGVYFSKRDSRSLVPKRDYPELGYTFNLGHPNGVKLLYSLLVGIPSFLALALIAAIFLGTTH